jgi:inosine-uridine nucleoside N-ribohydrolase
LTNVASAAQNGVDLAGGAREVIWMGGALAVRGNTTETGEWNACVDPEAAEICLSSGALDRIFPLDATQQAVFTLDDLHRLPETDLAGVAVTRRSASTSATTGWRTGSTAATSTTRWPWSAPCCAPTW